LRRTDLSTTAATGTELGLDLSYLFDGSGGDRWSADKRNTPGRLRRHTPWKNIALLSSAASIMSSHQFSLPLFLDLSKSVVLAYETAPLGLL